MDIRIYLLGWGGPVPEDLDVCPVEVEDLRAVSLEGCSGLILGDDALRRCSPEAISVLLQSQAVPVWLCPAQARAVRLRPWIEAGYLQIIRKRDLLALISAHGEAKTRPQLPASAWLRPEALGRCSQQEFQMIALLHELQELTVSTWAGALGCSRHALKRRCQRKLKTTPSELIWNYIDAQIRHGQKRGFTLEQLASLLGYSSAASLGHAIARRSQPPPPPDSRE